MINHCHVAYLSHGGYIDGLKQASNAGFCQLLQNMLGKIKDTHKYIQLSFDRGKLTEHACKTTRSLNLARARTEEKNSSVEVSATAQRAVNKEKKSTLSKHYN